jgi:serine/threonine-protein kinase RsbW
MHDRVVVRIPASTPHVGLVRATASALAAMLDFTFDRITDLHIAIDEACSRILATSSSPANQLEVTFQLEDESLVVTARGDAALRRGATVLPPWSETILNSVTKELSVDEEDGRAVITFRLTKGDWA